MQLQKQVEHALVWPLQAVAMLQLFQPTDTSRAFCFSIHQRAWINFDVLRQEPLVLLAIATITTVPDPLVNSHVQQCCSVCCPMQADLLPSQ
jgi:hypothetical protein